MQILSAALAFAITMLIFSMVTNVLVETIHRLARMRTTGLRLMLGHLFDRVIAPMLGQPDGAVLDAQREEFLDLMTVNRAPAGDAFRTDTDRTADSANADEGFWGFFRWPWQGRRLDELTVENFMSRLGGSSFGDEIRALGTGAGAEVEKVLADIGQKFIDFGDESSVFFQRRARFLAVVVSVLVAWFMYVQPFEIVSTFLRDPKVAEAVISMEAGVSEEYLKSLDKTITDKQIELDTALEAQSAEGGDAAAEEEAVDTLRRAVADAKTYAVKAASKLQDAGVPVGWNESRLTVAGFKMFDATLFVLPVPVSRTGFATAVWLFLGGVLVGLGGPFWYDVVKSLSSIRSVLGLAGPKVEDQTQTTDSSGTIVPKTAIDHFNVSAAGRDAVMGGVGEQDDEPAVG